MSTNAKTHLQTTVEIELARKGNGARYKVCLLRRSTLIAASTTGTAQSRQKAAHRPVTPRGMTIKH